MNRKLYVVEFIIGVIAVVLGCWISILVWRDGYFPGALMLVVTGFLSTLLAFKELKKITEYCIYHKVQTIALGKQF